MFSQHGYMENYELKTIEAELLIDKLWIPLARISNGPTHRELIFSFLSNLIIPFNGETSKYTMSAFSKGKFWLLLLA